MIPRLLHEIGIGEAAHVEADRRAARTRALHSDWEIRTWSSPVDAADFELGTLFESCGSERQIADLVRIEVLWRHGGICLGHDVEAVAPLDPLLPLALFATTPDGLQLSLDAVGADAGHAGVRALMDRLLELGAIPDGMDRRWTTGADLWSRTFEFRDDLVALAPCMLAPSDASPGPMNRGGSHAAVLLRQGVRDSPQPEVSGGPPAASTRLRRAVGGQVRRSIFPLLGRVAGEVAPPSRQTHGVYVGENRVLICTSDDTRLHAIADDQSLTPTLVQRGWYDDGLRRFLDRYLRAGDWFVDVGANIGLFTLAASKRVGRWGHVVAFEADTELAAVCRSNATMNWMRNVTVHAHAAGAQSGEIVFSRHPQFRGSSVAGSSEHGERAVSAGYEEFSVPVERLDDRVPPAVPLRIVKIDVEGGEGEVIAGMTQLLMDGRVDYIVAEVIRANAGSRWPALLEQLDWLVREHGAGLNTLQPDGTIEPISLDAVAVSAMFEQLVIDLTERPAD